MPKVSKNCGIYLRYFKIGQNFDIYLDTIASISLLGIYNCYIYIYVYAEKGDMKKYFHYFVN